MRIGFFTDNYFPRKDGVTYTIDTWRDKLEERGHEAFVVYPGSSEYEPQTNEIPIRAVNDPFYKDHKLALPLSWRKFPDTDVIHSHTPGPICFLARLKAKFNGASTVYTHHTPLENYIVHLFKSKLLSKILERAYLRLENFVLGSYDVVTSNTEEINREVDAVQLPVGIDMEFFQPTEFSFIDEMDFQRPIVGYSGRISEEKNLDELLLFAEKFDGTVLLIGEGRYRSKLEKEASRNVKFKDFVKREKLPEFYSGIDVFVTPSTGDTLGLSSLEANSCGTPVVAANVKPFDRTIQSQNGETYELGNIDDMNQKIKKTLSKDYNTREGVKKYSLTRTIDRLEELYKELN